MMIARLLIGIAPPLHLLASRKAIGHAIFIMTGQNINNYK